MGENDQGGRLRAYAELLSRRPIAWFIFWCIFILFFSVIGIVLRPDDLPNFDEPAKGLEPRGTYISGSWRAHRNYRDAKSNGLLTLRPEVRRLNEEPFEPDRCYHFDTDENNNILVFELNQDNSGNNLPTDEAVKYMCSVEELIIEYANSIGYDVCPSRSIGNYIKTLVSKSLCTDITESDVQKYLNLLRTCTPSFKSGNLVSCFDSAEDCAKLSSRVPSECWANNVAFDSLYALIDVDFLDTDNIHYIRTILRIGDLSSSERHRLVDTVLKENFDKEISGVNLIAYFFDGVKFKIFATQVTKDLVFAVLAFSIIYSIIWIHSGSGFFATFSFLQILLAVTVSYGFYMVVLYLPFFPYFNATALFIAVGLGADDVFVVVDAWKQTGKSDKSQSIASKVEKTIERSGGCILSTSATTGAAFAAVALSPITSLRCFGIFCSAIVMINYLFAISFIPCILIIQEKYFKGNRMCCSDCCGDKSGEKEMRKGVIEEFFRDRVSPFVQRYTSLILVLSSILIFGVGWNVSNLERSKSSDIKLLRPKHPFERYQAELDMKFQQNIAIEELKETLTGMPATFYFGISNEDNGNHLDPDDFGSLQFVDLDISSSEAQNSLVEFCRDVRTQPFYSMKVENVGPTRAYTELCNLEIFSLWVEFPCSLTSAAGSDYFTYPERADCCSETFPLPSKEKFMNCMKKFSNVLSDNFIDSGIRFKDDKLVAIEMPIILNQPYTNEYQPMKNIFDSIENFTSTWKNNAPGGSGLNSIFFYSWFSYTDLQDVIVSGAYKSAALSIMVATLILLVMTWSPILTVLSIVTVFSTVVVVGSILVFMGWELDVLESIVVSVACGLAVDFSVHYCHTFLNSPSHLSLSDKITFMYEKIGISVLTGASTTFFAGLALSFAKTLILWQFGVFLMLTMTFSFTFSTFLLPSLILVTLPRFTCSSNPNVAKVGPDSRIQMNSNE